MFATVLSLQPRVATGQGQSREDVSGMGWQGDRASGYGMSYLCQLCLQRLRPLFFVWGHSSPINEFGSSNYQGYNTHLPIKGCSIRASGDLATGTRALYLALRHALC